MRKVHFRLVLAVTAILDDGVEVGEILDEAEVSLTDTTTKATIEDVEVLDYEVTDSK